MTSRLFIKGLNIYTPEVVLDQSTVLINDGVISQLGKDIAQTDCEVLEFPANWHLLPGFIDVHMHGAAGADAMDGDLAALQTISRALPREGVTAFLATTMTEDAAATAKALQNVAAYKRAAEPAECAELLGVNLEGPFLAPEKAGAQRKEELHAIDLKLLGEWLKLAEGWVKIVTLAPELASSEQMIRYLCEQHIVAAIGHTNASYEQAQLAIAAGATHATHLFNAMTKIHQREPGVAVAALLSDKVMCEVIADGVHLHPAMLEMVLRLKTSDEVILVTDAMRAKQLGCGKFNLGGQEVIVDANTARLADGTLAGSILRMDVAVRNMLRFTDCDLQDICKMAAENPARQLGVFARKGSIELNKDADLCIFDEHMHLQATVIRGVVIRP